MIRNLARDFDFVDSSTVAIAAARPAGSRTPKTPYFMRIAKLKSAHGRNIFAVAARHNLRDGWVAKRGNSKKIDAARSHLNTVLKGPRTAKEVVRLAKRAMHSSGITKTRKNAVLGIEIVFGLPAGHGIDEDAYFEECTRWAATAFGGEQNVLSSVIHRDQPNPHCHVLILPLQNGKLNGSAMVGDRQGVASHHETFYASVAARYGLPRPPAPPTSEQKQSMAASVFRILWDSADTALVSSIWPQIQKSVAVDPVPYLRILKSQFDQQSQGNLNAAESSQTICSVGSPAGPGAVSMLEGDCK